MLTYKNNSDTLFVVLHEIYGVNDHIKTVSESLARRGFDVICPDMLHLDKPFVYEKERDAYQFFMQNIGFKSAAQSVSAILYNMSAGYKHIYLLGYSIGATIGWLCCSTIAKCDGLIGYYGSRIRDYLDTVPQYPVLLFFAEQESSFNTKELQQKMLNHPNIEVHIMNGCHGFDDPFSKNYNALSSKESKTLLEGFISSHS